MIKTARLIAACVLTIAIFGLLSGCRAGLENAPQTLPTWESVGLKIEQQCGSRSLTRNDRLDMRDFMARAMIERAGGPRKVVPQIDDGSKLNAIDLPEGACKWMSERFLFLARERAIIDPLTPTDVENFLMSGWGETSRSYAIIDYADEAAGWALSTTG